MGITTFTIPGDKISTILEWILEAIPQLNMRTALVWKRQTFTIYQYVISYSRIQLPRCWDNVRFHKNYTYNWCLGFQICCRSTGHIMDISLDDQHSRLKAELIGRLNSLHDWNTRRLLEMQEIEDKTLSCFLSIYELFKILSSNVYS